VDLSALDEALQQLEKLDERKVRVVELRFFAGMTNQEAAELLGVSPKTTEADWYFARAWLRRALSEESG
jgi:RNA polymerase sigma factor (sigma-70 family)